MWILIPLLLLMFDSLYIGSQLTSFKSIYLNIQKSPLKVRYSSAILCYAFLTILLYYFILKPNRPIRDAFLLGVCVYGVYDTTTYALLKDYPLSLACIDTLWGGLLFAMVTYVYRLILKKITL
jgi:uncharacterized membrane protein